ncbi:hypothetical protein [Anaerosinus massiliensis]|uniref:hypothetical protein n=1 Tax=Massilibacillus massiliensis TaxID=1806837 RepID=UPI0018FEA053|nr:hypothetical protein [Massilibacillus massiliensis]
MNKTTWGGHREGAGAKKKAPDDAKRRNILMTDDEYEKVKSLLDELRNANK